MGELSREQVEAAIEWKSGDQDAIRRLLARQLLNALDRIEALEADRGPWRPDGGTDD